jgi:hypothetical protein
MYVVENFFLGVGGGGDEKPILTEISAITVTAAVQFTAVGIIPGHWNPILYYELFNVRY